jgi:hypothetical protein
LKSKPTVIRTETRKLSHCGIPSARLGNWLAHDIDVSLRCRHCQAATLVLIGELVERLGEDYPVPEVGARARCARYGYALREAYRMASGAFAWRPDI